jgi:hypothetical protein
MPHDDKALAGDTGDKKAPETPPDEPKPTPVQDPPAEPIKVPYVVRRDGAPTRVTNHE